MKFDLSKNLDIKRASMYLSKLAEKKSMIEVKEKRNKRSIPQNSYFHVVIALFCDETGYTMQEAKVLLKREFGKFMIYEKEGQKFLVSSASLDSLQMSDFIEWIRNVACYENLGVYIPTPDEYLENQRDIDIKIAYLYDK